MEKNIQIIYEDEDLLAIAKPAGLVVEPDEHHNKLTLSELIKREYKSACLLHRLDKDTSGVILFSKNDEAYEFYKSLFHDHKIEKTYTALVIGRVKEKEGVIDSPIGRSKKDPRKRTTLGDKGILRNAKTIYKVSKRFGDKYTLLEVNPKTGRTHQVRSHLAYIKHPVVCDKLYSGKLYECPFGLTRHFLHALSLTFNTKSGKRIKIEAEIPEDLLFVLKSL